KKYACRLNLPLSIISPVIVSGSALLIILLERLIPYDKRQRILREGLFNDLALYTIVQSYLLGFVIFGCIGWIDGATSLSRLRLVSAWPIPMQVIFFFVLHDLYSYGFHRLQHRYPFLWRIHEAHHSTRDVDWLSGARSHSLEILINQTIEFAPIILLGASPEVALIKGIIDAVWGMYIHSNIDIHSGALQYVINGPEMHRWHHATDDEAHNRNFSTKLAIWDWIFGTAYFPASKKPSGYGLDDPDFPKGYIGQHVYAFRRERKKP
ncbi:MAG: sterol desaturase family protein, partial [Bacteroidota bacterium]